MDEIEIKTSKMIVKSMLNAFQFEKYHKILVEIKELDEKKKKLRKELERVLDELKGDV